VRYAAPTTVPSGPWFRDIYDVTIGNCCEVRVTKNPPKQVSTDTRADAHAGDHKDADGALWAQSATPAIGAL